MARDGRRAEQRQLLDALAPPRGSQTRSKTAAMPCPPPMHIVTSA
jgi:hypothetical protein